MVERVNGVITEKLRIKLAENPKRKWSSLLGSVTEELNAIPHEVTGYPPRYLMFGITAPGPLPASHEPLAEARELAVARTKAMQLKNKQAYDNRHRHVVFTEGQLVLRRIPANHPERHKLSPAHDGPFTILRQCGPVNYIYARFPGDPKPVLAHVSQLRVFNPRPESVAQALE